MRLSRGHVSHVSMMHQSGVLLILVSHVHAVISHKSCDILLVLAIFFAWASFADLCFNV